MQSLFYYSTTDLDLSDLENCLSTKYKLTREKNKPWGELIYVFYDVLHNDSLIEVYTRWILEDISLDGGDFPSITDKVKEVFYVEFRVYQLDKLIPILQDVLKCYNGYFHYNGKNYQLENIQEFKNVELEE